MTRITYVLVLAVALFMAPGCASDDEGGSAAQPSAEAQETEEAEESRCEKVPAEMVKRLESGLTVAGGGTLRNAQAVKSDDYEAVHFVSAEIDGAGMEGDGEVGTWATNALTHADGAGLTFAVGSFATRFSDWGDGGKTDAELSMSDDGAQESVACVRDAG